MAGFTPLNSEPLPDLSFVPGTIVLDLLGSVVLSVDLLFAAGVYEFLERTLSEYESLAEVRLEARSVTARVLRSLVPKPEV